MSAAPRRSIYCGCGMFCPTADMDWIEDEDGFIFRMKDNLDDCGRHRTATLACSKERDHTCCFPSIPFLRA